MEHESLECVAIIRKIALRAFEILNEALDPNTLMTSQLDKGVVDETGDERDGM